MPPRSEVAWIHSVRAYAPGDEHRVEPPDPARARALLGPLAVSERLHRFEIRGFEHVPRVGAGLLVGFHPFYPLGTILLMKRVLERDGRVVRGLTDHLVWSVPGVRDIWATLGVVDGTRDNASRLLAAGELAVCMPGGALEWSRSSRQRRTLRWGEHRGYARMAVRANVPVIPTCCPAADDLFWIANDGWEFGTGAGRRIGRLLGLNRPLPLPLPVGLGLLAFPVKLVQHVAPPEWPLGEDAGDEEARVRELDARVRRVMLGLLTRG